MLRRGKLRHCAGCRRLSYQASEWSGNVLHEKNQKEDATQVLLADLKACSRARNLERGQQLHGKAAECGYGSSNYVANALINMYAKCGSMLNAQRVFEDMEDPTVGSWTALILGYAENGQGLAALDLFERMRSEGPAPDSVAFMAAVKACTSLALKKGASGYAECRERAKKIYKLAVENGCHTSIYVQSSLIDMFAKCGSMVDARQIFDSLQYPNVVAWNTLILGYVLNGQGLTALNLFSKMRSEGPAPDSLTFVAAFKACASLASREGADCGKEIHNFAVQEGCHLEHNAQNTLIDMYAKCGNMVAAWQVFQNMKHPSVVSWTALILGYAESGQDLTALHLFARMKAEGLAPDSVAFVGALRACINLALKGAKTECRLRGTGIYNLIVENGCDSDIYVQSSLIDMYAKSNNMVDAQLVFDNVAHPDVVSWTALILGYADNGQGIAALDLFTRMETVPKCLTFVAALKACTSLVLQEGWRECRQWGKLIYNLAIEIGCDSDNYVQSSLIDVYAKCGSMEDARQVFDSMHDQDLVSWNTLILGYADNGEGSAALEMFTRMKSEGPAADNVTFLAALRACTLTGDLEAGTKIHSEIKSDLGVTLLNCLVDFYAKCGRLAEAQKIFYAHADQRDIITWTAMLAGFSSCGDHKSVMELFKGMQDVGYQPDSITFLCVLACCSHAGLVEKGKECFDSMSTKYGIIPTVEHYNCMVDILGRTNKIHDAMALLRGMSCSGNDVTWTTILSACGKWKNLWIGRLAFQSLIDMNAAAYVQMGQIYESRGMFQEQEMLMEVMKNR